MSDVGTDVVWGGTLVWKCAVGQIHLEHLVIHGVPPDAQQQWKMRPVNVSELSGEGRDVRWKG